MFERVNTGDIPAAALRAYESSPSYQRMVKVYAESQEAFRHFDVVNFTRLYKGESRPSRGATFLSSHALSTVLFLFFAFLFFLLSCCCAHPLRGPGSYVGAYSESLIDKLLLRQLQQTLPSMGTL